MNTQLQDLAILIRTQLFDLFDDVDEFIGDNAPKEVYDYWKEGLRQDFITTIYDITVNSMREIL